MEDNLNPKQTLMTEFAIGHQKAGLIDRAIELGAISLVLKVEGPAPELHAPPPPMKDKEKTSAPLPVQKLRRFEKPLLLAFIPKENDIAKKHNPEVEILKKEFNELDQGALSITFATYEGEVLTLEFSASKITEVY
jgi:hypothetical protein